MKKASLVVALAAHSPYCRRKLALERPRAPSSSTV